ncbi:SoxR reducing system RseC family protein [Bowmanella sp. JS7-9]|uniref:SoxR reducing system RseC family protein n=1 Tax=Pseudobowmanella zhangzhouensis TaxID=1537679 RepID=A0ABW1XIF9_9ALTE|nr:SoxR reducing system RseC family protein [Bowmanella sp. JS7-9]TBX25896.1 hypothetical protein TK45_04315 [Bowmanella sp. JS7-9]
MMQEMAEVVAVEAGRICVQTQIKTTCNACQANSDCGTGVVASALAPKMQQFWLETGASLKVGQQVKIGIPEQQVLIASLLLYLLPLIVLITSVLLLESRLSEGWLILVSAAMAAGSYWPLKGYFSRRERQYQPILLDVSLPQVETPIRQIFD